MNDLRRLAEQHLRAFNERDFHGWLALLHEDVRIVGDGGTWVGAEGAHAYAVEAMRNNPGVVAELDRVVAESEDAIVLEFRLVRGERSDPSFPESGVCAVLRMRDRRIVELRNYYVPLASGPEAVRRPSRVGVDRLLSEQASLRRVATLVAQGVSQEELFATVAEEVRRLVGSDAMALLRFEPGDAVTLVAAHAGVADAAVPIGGRAALDGPLRRLRDEGRSVRLGAGDALSAVPFGEAGSLLGARSWVGVPIAVEGSVWGVAMASSIGPVPLPSEAEDRLAEFTELLATAIANAQARSELRRLIEEQTALRRLATLVAEGASRQQAFDAVTAEASRLIGGQGTVLLRYRPDGSAAIVAHHARMPLPTRLAPLGGGITDEVLRTGRTARVDDYRLEPAPTAAFAAEIGMQASVGAPIAVGGRLWGVLLTASTDAPLPLGAEQRLTQFAELAATAIAVADTRDELTASRARLVAAADESRRRIQRDLHDGAQQRLVSTLVALKLLKRALGDVAGEPADLLDEALVHAAEATAELRELVQGIMPAALTRGGLRPGIRSLAERVHLRVEQDVTPARFDRAVEATAYFAVAEALTNAVKHAGVGTAHVSAGVRGELLELVVRDDGVGGADPAAGSGLRGLIDRVTACGGRLEVSSPAGAGTTMTVTLPVAAQARR